LDAATRALAVALRQSLEAEDSPTTVTELWPAFELANKGRLRSWRDHAQRWRDHVCPFFGGRRAVAVGPADVDDYRARRLAAGAALATINREIALARRLLRFSARRKTIAASGLHGQGMTAELIWKEKNVRQTVVEDNPASRITLPQLLAAADRRLRAFILLLHRSGMRRTEAALLQRDRVNVGLGVAWVPDVDTKGGDGGRYVPLSPDVWPRLPRSQRAPATPTCSGPGGPTRGAASLITRTPGPTDSAAWCESLDSTVPTARPGSMTCAGRSSR
jgi:integrase